ncbi:Nucleoside diphosphate kinase, partial [Caligus rogercresseyi]
MGILSEEGVVGSTLLFLLEGKGSIGDFYLWNASIQPSQSLRLGIKKTLSSKMIPPHSALTLAIIKPDIASVPYILIFLVLRSKTLKFSPGLAQDFYQEHHGKLFLQSPRDLMSSGPSCVSVLAHPRGDAIGKWREIMGPTKPIFHSGILWSHGHAEWSAWLGLPGECEEGDFVLFPDFEFEKAAQMIERRKELRLDV